LLISNCHYANRLFSKEYVQKRIPHWQKRKVIKNINE
jgi:hypothetical protein